MSSTQGSVVRNVLLAGLVSIGLTSAAFAQTSSSAAGLGQSWPNAADVSATPNWHVYVFHLHGIKYVQINDLGGTVHAAIGTANGTAIVLPVGVDAHHVATSAASVSSGTEVVYRDADTTVTATPVSDGVTAFSVQTVDSTCHSLDCNGAGSSSQLPQP
jgi:hypothetical protein